LQLRDGQPRRRTAAALFAFVGDAPVVRLVIALEGQQRAGFRQRPGGVEQFLEIGAATDQAPTEADSRPSVQVKPRLRDDGQ
jgi:hypothetical protein